MTALRTAQLETSTLSHRFFFVQASVPSWLASAPHRGTNVSPSMTYAHHIPPACRVMPKFFYFMFLSHFSIIHVHFFMFLNKGIYTHANAATKIRKFRHICIPHIENHAYGFLAGMWLQWAVSPLWFNNLGKFGLILIGASDEANMLTSSKNVTTLK